MGNKLYSRSLRGTFLTLLTLSSSATEDIMGGNVKLILGLVWMLIQKYHIQVDDAKRCMLDWIQVHYYYSRHKNNCQEI